MRYRKAVYAALRSIEAQKQKPGAKEWLAIRKEAGQKLDPEAAEVICRYVQIADPYGVCADFPEELDCVGRLFFARSPESDIWVEFGDLPKATVEKLMRWMESGDYDKSPLGQDRDRIVPLTYEIAQAEVQVALRRNLWTSGLLIEECRQLPDGRFQFIAKEHLPNGSSAALNSIKPDVAKSQPTAPSQTEQRGTQ